MPWRNLWRILLLEFQFIVPSFFLCHSDTPGWVRREDSTWWGLCRLTSELQCSTGAWWLVLLATTPLVCDCTLSESRGERLESSHSPCIWDDWHHALTNSQGKRRLRFPERPHNSFMTPLYQCSLIPSFPRNTSINHVCGAGNSSWTHSWESSGPCPLELAKVRRQGTEHPRTGVVSPEIREGPHGPYHGIWHSFPGHTVYVWHCAICDFYIPKRLSLYR